MENVKFYALKIDLSDVKNEDFPMIIGKISAKMREADAVAMEPESMFLPHFYALFKKRRQAEEFRKAHKDWFRPARMSVAKEPVMVSADLFKPEYIKGMKRYETPDTIEENHHINMA